MKLGVVLLVFSGLGLATARLLPLHASGKQLFSAQDSPSNLHTPHQDALLQQKTQVMMHHIQQAAASSGARAATNHATSAYSRDGADVLGGALSHADRRRLAGTQENMVSSTTNVQDALRQATAAEARSRIRSAVDSGGSREMTLVAAQGVSLATPLRRALRQESTALTDTFRAIQQQDRAAASTAMIRRAVNGEMDVSEAISGASARPRPGNLVSSVVAERAAGTVSQRQQLP